MASVSALGFDRWCRWYGSYSRWGGGGMLAAGSNASGTVGGAGGNGGGGGGGGATPGVGGNGFVIG